MVQEATAASRPFGRFGDVEVRLEPDHVATVEIQRPPSNFFDTALIDALADAYEALDATSSCRAIILCSEGKHFCAGADFSGRSVGTPGLDPLLSAKDLYRAAARLFDAQLPVIAAIQGAAVGGGLGVACAADFRVGSTQARFAANFARLGFHHGFGLTVTLPRIVGPQHALELLYTGRRIAGDEAHAIGLCDRVVAPDSLREAAHALASEIGRSAPLAVRSIRATMRASLATAFRAATERELGEQHRLRSTADFAEGIRASAERRDPLFKGR
ncbi:MAG TPA: enoyl-CoA hydratase/isomerase family protein [Acidimicrobiales bacterium]|nr:enoyl-CoA hydratase/isomerase family protein [Acidimicrobiales bacterium]